MMAVPKTVKTATPGVYGRGKHIAAGRARCRVGLRGQLVALSRSGEIFGCVSIKEKRGKCDQRPPSPRSRVSDTRRRLPAEIVYGAAGWEPHDQQLSPPSLG